MSTMDRNEFHAAIGRLESLVKGQGSTQIFHTPSDSNPGQWAGSGQVDQDEHNDGIDENGTDYTGVKKALAEKVAKSKALTPAEVAIVKGLDPRPVIADKIAKGGSLTQAESWAIKGGAAKMGFGKTGSAKSSTKPGEAPASGDEKDAGSVPETNAGGDAVDSEIEPDAKKSLEGAVAQTQNLRKGIEMSPILAEFARAMGEGLRGVEARTAQNIVKAMSTAVGPLVQRIANIEGAISKHIDEQGTFNKGFAEAVVGIGQTLAGSAEVAAAGGHAPAGAPKSHLRAVPQGAPQGLAPVQKSFGPGGLDMGGDALAKSQVVDAMFDLVKGGKLNQLELIKFESSGEMNPSVRQMVVSHIQGGAR